MNEFFPSVQQHSFMKPEQQSQRCSHKRSKFHMTYKTEQDDKSETDLIMLRYVFLGLAGEY